MTDISQLTLDYVIQPAQTFTYIHVPFEVPPHMGRIDVAYTYDSAISSDPNVTGGNTIDIGIIDPRGTQFMTQGFRGWSGSARQQFYLAEESATPGYMPGPIQAGTWHICLGAYKVAAAGCHCQITITLTASVRSDEAHFPALLPVRTTTRRPRNPDGWYKGDLHCHTLHSDGDSLPKAVVCLAERLGFDFLAITDHNVRSHLADLAQVETDLVLIPGYEVTTYYGHWNIWGDGAWIDFRIESPADLQRAIQEARDQGYLVSCNHPRPWSPEWAFPEVEGYACVEAWNGPWVFFNAACREFWETRLKSGQRLVAVGGSDFHYGKEDHPARLGHPTVYVHCAAEPSAANLLESLRAGHAFVTESPTGPRLDLRCGAAMMGDSVVSSEPIICTVTVTDGDGAEVQLCSAAGMLTSFPVTQSPQTFEVTVETGSSLYIRAQLVGVMTGHCLALTNPIYLSDHAAH